MTLLINVLGGLVVALGLTVILVLAWWTRSWPDPRKGNLRQGGVPLGRVKPRKEWA